MERQRCKTLENHQQVDNGAIEKTPRVLEIVTTEQIHPFQQSTSQFCLRIKSLSCYVGLGLKGFCLDNHEFAAFHVNPKKGSVNDAIAPMGQFGLPQLTWLANYNHCCCRYLYPVPRGCLAARSFHKNEIGAPELKLAYCTFELLHDAECIA